MEKKAESERERKKDRAADEGANERKLRKVKAQNARRQKGAGSDG